MEKSDRSKEVLLTYYTATLRQYDLNFLGPGQWLNDAIINFYMEYLTRKHLVTTASKKSIKLLDPAVVSGFPYCQDDKEDLDDMFGPLGLSQAD